MKESLERLVKESDYNRLVEGLEHFFKKQKEVLRLLQEDSSEFILEMANVQKLLRVRDERTKDELLHRLRKALEHLEELEDDTHVLAHKKLRVA